METLEDQLQVPPFCPFYSWFAQINWSSRNATKTIGFQAIDKQASL